MSELITLLAIILVISFGLLIWRINWQNFRSLALIKQATNYQPSATVVVYFNGPEHDFNNLEQTLKSTKRLNYDRLEPNIVLIDQEIYRYSVKKLAKSLKIGIKVVKINQRRQLSSILNKQTSAKIIFNLKSGSTISTKSFKSSISSFQNRSLSGLTLRSYSRLTDKLETSFERQIEVLNQVFQKQAIKTADIASDGLFYRPSRVKNDQVKSSLAKESLQFIESSSQQSINLSPKLVIIGMVYGLFIGLNLFSSSSELGLILAISAGIAIVLGLNLVDRQPILNWGEYVSQCLITPYALVALPIIRLKIRPKLT